MFTLTPLPRLRSVPPPTTGSFALTAMDVLMVRDGLPMFSLTLHLLGPPRLEKEGAPVEFGRRKAMALLAYLAATGRSHSRDSLAALLWPQYSQQEARADLRRMLSVLNKRLGDGWLVMDQGAVALRRSAQLWLDVDQFHQGLSACDAHGHPTTEVCSACLPVLHAAVALYHDDFLAGFSLPDSPGFDEWQFFEAERLRQRLASALAQLVQSHREREEWEPAISYTRRWLALDPLQEAVCRQLMQLYVESGQPQAALRQYHVCVDVLNKELGIGPAAETAALYEQIKQNKVAWTAPATRGQGAKLNDSVAPVLMRTSAGIPLQSSLSSHHNLPLQTTPFVGREQELAAVLKRLHDPSCHLLNLVGPGGMGKSRLAIQAAQVLVNAPQAPALFGHGVWFVELAAVSSAAEVVATIAEALKLSFYGSVPPKQHLLDYLGEKALLLVLDNFEHLLTSMDIVADILVSAPAVKLLVTSREALNLQEEWLYPVEGMAIPPLAAERPAGEAWETLEAYDAIRLFVQSARRVHTNFHLAQESQAIIRICQLVEGMPLGIELAAAWLKIYSCAAIAREIEHNLDFLSSRLRNVPERHRSMRAVFDHSWRLLAEAERNVLKRLSVFAGGFRLEAAAHVAGASRATLVSLVDKSLLRAAANERYQMHELLKQFAAEKLSESPVEQSDTRARHSTYYLTFLSGREQALNGRDQQKALVEISEELENVRAGWNWAVEQGNLDALAQALESLYEFYQVRSRYQEGAELFAHTVQSLQAMPLMANTQFLLVLEKILARCGALYSPLGLLEPAQAYMEQSLQMARELDRPASIAFSLLYLGEVVHWRGKNAEAKHLFLESLALSRRIGNLYRIADALNKLSEMDVFMEGSADAKRFAQEALAASRKTGRPDWIAKALDALGAATFCTGEYAESENHYQETFALSRELEDQLGMSFALGGLAWSAWVKGDTYYAEAKRLAEESLVIVRECGHRFHVGTRLVILGQILISGGQYAEAQQCFQEGLAIGRSLAEALVTARCLCGLGEISCHHGNLRATRSYLLEALKIAITAQLVLQVVEILVHFAVLLLQESDLLDKRQRLEKKMYSVELLALALEHPACWHHIRVRAARILAAVEVELPEHTLVDAKNRGKHRELQEIVAEILQSETAMAHLDNTQL
jgi:predicted ATPase/DNA-binding SARP family transcriptional activator